MLSSFLSRFIPRVSTPLVQILIGALATTLPFFPEAQLEPDLFMVLFIAPLLYLEAHRIDKTALVDTLGLSLSMAVGLVLVTMVAVGFSVHAVWPAISLAAAFALGGVADGQRAGRRRQQRELEADDAGGVVEQRLPFEDAQLPPRQRGLMAQGRCPGSPRCRSRCRPAGSDTRDSAR